MTPAEAEVVEAAKAWRVLKHGEDFDAEYRLCKGIDALSAPPPPPLPLVERLRGYVPLSHMMGEDARLDLMLEAIGELERRENEVAAATHSSCRQNETFAELEMMTAERNEWRAKAQSATAKLERVLEAANRLGAK